MIPKINPAIPKPFESSLIIPIMPKIIAKLGSKKPPQSLRIIHKIQPTHIPSIPKTKDKIPKTLLIIFTNFYKFIL